MQNISHFKKNILQFIDYKGIKKSEFYRLTGITRGVLDHETGLTEDNLTKFIATYPEVNLEWVITGQGSMIRKAVTYPSDDSVNFVMDEPVNYLRTPSIITVDSHNEDNIVLVPQTMKAGYLQGYNDKKFISKLPTYRMPGLSNGVFRMFPVEGNSMYPTLTNNSFVVGEFIENWITGIKDNRLYVIISNQVEDGLVKRCINRIEKYNNLICKSDNRRNYPNVNVEPQSIKEIWEVKLHLNFDLPDPGDLYDRMNDMEAEMEEMKRKLLK